MKTLLRILILLVIVCVIYFASIGRDDFYSMVQFVEDLMKAIADNYLKK